MFFLQKAKNWAHSSISDDKQELETYQVFKNEIDNIKKIRQEYITEEGSKDPSLAILYNGKVISISLLASLKESILNNKSLSLNAKMQENALLEELYRERLKELEDRIIIMAISNPSNVYLKQISSSINIINTLLRRYAHLIAVQKSGVKSINMGNDLKNLEDNILIRISEIEYRIATDTMKRY